MEKVIVHRIDDLTGQHGEDVTQIDFEVDGIAYEIDLSEGNANTLRDLFAAYTRVARKRKPVTTNPSYNGSSGNKKEDKEAVKARKERIKTIRAWAAERAVEQPEFAISEFGRLPLVVELAWEKAMAAKAEADDDVVSAEIVDDEHDQTVGPAPQFAAQFSG